VALIVSEERGTMAYAIGGKVTENISRQDVLDFLNKEFSHDILRAR
jgi:hypothetical protein